MLKALADMSVAARYQGVVHASAQVEDKTPFAKKYTIDVKPLPSTESTADMYRAASSVLRSAGYEHYEVSNYARPGHRCLNKPMTPSYLCCNIHTSCGHFAFLGSSRAVKQLRRSFMCKVRAAQTQLFYGCYVMFSWVSREVLLNQTQV